MLLPSWKKAGDRGAAEMLRKESSLFGLYVCKDDYISYIIRFQSVLLRFAGGLAPV